MNPNPTTISSGGGMPHPPSPFFRNGGVSGFRDYVCLLVDVCFIHVFHVCGCRHMSISTLLTIRKQDPRDRPKALQEEPLFPKIEPSRPRYATQSLGFRA